MNRTAKEMGKSQDKYRYAKTLIPGGTQLLSKRPELFLPDQWPAYYSKAKGCEVWDLDGHHYVDMSLMGVGSCLLGYADDAVNAAVKQVVDDGNMCTLNTPLEVELAEELCRRHPWATQARFVRSGGEAMAVAARIVRAATGRTKILVCGYHGWHDWYLAANLGDASALNNLLLPGLEPRGVPGVLRGTTVPFYFDKPSFLEAFQDHKEDLAAVIMEPIRFDYPPEDLLPTIRDATRQAGIPLVFDEITSAWRLHLGGAHMKFGIEPDMAVFGKAMSNGYPMGAIIGRQEIMKNFESTFISSTYWTEAVGPAASLAAISQMEDAGMVEHLSAAGGRIQEGWARAAEEAGLDVTVGGIPPLSKMNFRGKDPLALKTLFTQLMLDRGYLATTAVYVSLAHTQAVVEDYLRNVGEVFKEMAHLIAEDKVGTALRGPVCHSGFQRLNTKD